MVVQRKDAPAGADDREFAVIFAASTISHVLNFIIVGLGLLLVLTILIQKGKGGGLVGAFGGAGGSSAFGSKAGDTFTRITVGMAGAWILLIMVHVLVAKNDQIEHRTSGSELVQPAK